MFAWVLKENVFLPDVRLPHDLLVRQVEIPATFGKDWRTGEPIVGTEIKWKSVDERFAAALFDEQHLIPIGDEAPVLEHGTARIFNGSDDWAEALGSSEDDFVKFPVIRMNGRWFGENLPEKSDWFGKVIPDHQVQPEAS